MDTTQLRYFVAVARAGSLSAACAELKVTQPTLSVAVQRLESRVGARLFERGRGGMTLTAKGRELLAHATEMLALVERAEGKAPPGVVPGRVRIGCAAGLGAGLLPTMLASFMDAYSGIELDLINDASPAIVDAVLARSVDLGIVVNPRPHAELALDELYRDRAELYVAGAAAPLDAAAAMARVRSSPLIFVDDADGQAMLAALRVCGLVPVGQLACGAVQLVRTLTARGNGVGVLPRRFAAAEGADTAVVTRLGHDLPSIDLAVCLAHRLDAPRNRIISRITAALLAQGRRLAVS